MSFWFFSFILSYFLSFFFFFQSRPATIEIITVTFVIFHFQEWAKKTHLKKCFKRDRERESGERKKKHRKSCTRTLVDALKCKHQVKRSMEPKKKTRRTERKAKFIRFKKRRRRKLKLLFHSQSQRNTAQAIEWLK